MYDPCAQLETPARTVTYFAVSSAALLVYDYILTFADEVHYIWRKPQRIVNVLFLLTRYLVVPHITLILYRLLPSDSPKSCSLWLHISGWMFILGVAIAEIIMSLRVWALWGGDRKVATFLVVLVTASVGVSGVYFERFYDSESFMSLDSPFLPFAGCYPIGSHIALINGGFISLMVSETVILVMTIIIVEKSYTHTSLAYAFIQDGLGYFAAMFGISLVTTIIIFLASPDYVTLLEPHQRVLHAMLSGRIVLHLGQESAKYAENPSHASSISSISFRVHSEGTTQQLRTDVRTTSIH